MDFLKAGVSVVTPHDCTEPRLLTNMSPPAQHLRLFLHLLAASQACLSPAIIVTYRIPPCLFVRCSAVA